MLIHVIYIYLWGSLCSITPKRTAASGVTLLVNMDGVFRVLRIAPSNRSSNLDGGFKNMFLIFWRLWKVEVRICLACIYIYILIYTLGIQSPCQMMIGVYNHLLSKVFRFHYHSQKVIGSLGIHNDIHCVHCTVGVDFDLSWRREVSIYVNGTL